MDALGSGPAQSHRGGAAHSPLPVIPGGSRLTGDSAIVEEREILGIISGMVSFREQVSGWRGEYL